MASLSQGGFTVCIGNKGDDQSDLTLPGYRHRPQKFSGDPGLRVHGKECTIPSTPGEEFCIHVAYNHSQRGSRVAGAGFCVVVLFDDAWATAVFWPAEELEQGGGELEITEFLGVGGGKCDLRFIRRELTDDNPAEDEEPDIEWLNTISVRVYWAFETPPGTTDEEDEAAVEDLLYWLECIDILTSPLNERKGVKYSTGIEYAPGKEQVVEEPETKKYWIQPANNQDYWFVFHHRHPAWLVAKGIAPRSILPSKENAKSSTSTPIIKSEECEPLSLRSSIKRKGRDPLPSSKEPTRASKRTRRN
ncbi:hypothetical protein FRC08_016443 [Ceratobasidium sp. 394]|nr:hypothetical protein FRC08_016443 [Ceratobasidium sp. 394]